MIQQHPDVPPRYRFRPRSDRNWRLPAFRDGRPPRLHAQPFETYEPTPFAWDELTPGVWLRGLCVFVALCAFVLAASVIGYKP